MSFEEDTELTTLTEKEEKKPKRYIVLFHNDDYTSFEFVLGILRVVFHKSPEEAFDITSRVHHLGLAVVGEYPQDVAETSVAIVEELAVANGYPLLATVEEVME